MLAAQRQPPVVLEELTDAVDELLPNYDRTRPASEHEALWRR